MSPEQAAMANFPEIEMVMIMIVGS